MIEWFLVGIKLYGSIAFLRFFLSVLSHWMFHQSSSHCSLSELPLGFLSCAEPWIFKNTNGDISTTHYPCWKKKVIRYWLLFHSFGYYYPTQLKWKWGNVGATYKLDVWGIPIHSSYWNRIYLSPTSFIERIIPSSRLS